MSDQNLTEAERWARECVNANACTWPGPVAVLLAEYDRRGDELAAAAPVVEAAEAAARQWNRYRAWAADVRHTLPSVGVSLDSLAARVRAYTDTTTEKKT